MAVEDADDLDPLICLPIDHQMRTTWMDPHRRRELSALTGDVRELNQKIEECEEPVGKAPGAVPSHLLEVIERLGAKGAFFRSLTDPIDTSSPQGKFTLQVLGAAAEFERALIRERTKAGLASARSKGRIGGNPGLRARDPAALRKVRLARQDGYLERLNETAQDWVPHVRRLRPDITLQAICTRLEAMRERTPCGRTIW